MDQTKCYCGIALSCPIHKGGLLDDPVTQKDVWHDQGSWWCKNDLEDDVHGPFETFLEAVAVFEEMG